MLASSRSVLVAVVSLVLWSTSVALGDPPRAPTLDSVLAEFSRVPGLTADFREEKRLALLAAPLVSEGTIAYASGGSFVRRTTRPTPSTVLIDGGNLRVASGSRTEQIDMRAMPLVRQFVESFLAVIRGDKRALEAAYRTTFSVQADGRGWSLSLVPRDSSLARVFASVSLDGHGALLERLVVRETSGDESTTTFTRINTTRRFTAEERQELFRLP